MICPVQLWAPQARESQEEGGSGGWRWRGDRGNRGDGRVGAGRKWELRWELMKLREGELGKSSLLTGIPDHFITCIIMVLNQLSYLLQFSSQSKTMATYIRGGRDWAGTRSKEVAGSTVAWRAPVGRG